MYKLIKPKVCVYMKRREISVFFSLCNYCIFFGKEGDLRCCVQHVAKKSSLWRVYSSVRLYSQYAIIDTRKQAVYVRVDTIWKVQLITELLNQYYSQKMMKKELANYLDHE